MKITVKHKDSQIIVSESDNIGKDKTATMRYADQNMQIQDTIKVMVEQILKLSEPTDQ